MSDDIKRNDKLNIPNIGNLREGISGVAYDILVYCQVTSSNGETLGIYGEPVLQTTERGFVVFNFNKDDLERFLGNMDNESEEVEEFDNSLSGIIANFDGMDNSDLKDVILQRIDYISSAEKKVREAESRLEALKFDLENNKNGLKHIINFKKLEYPVMIDDPKNYYEVSRSGEQIYIKTINKQL